MIPAGKVLEGMTIFIESEILPSLSGWQLIAAGAGIALINQKSVNAVKMLSGNKMVLGLGLMDESGNLDVNTAAEAVKESIRKHGKLDVSIPAIGDFRFAEKDINALVACINRAAGSEGVE